MRSEDLKRNVIWSPRLLIVLALLLFNILAVSALDMSQNKVSQWTLDEGATPFADNSTGGLSPLASSGSVTSVKSFQGNGTSFGSNGYLRPSANVARLGANIAGKRTMLMWINITGLPDASDTVYTEYQVNQNLLRFNTANNYTMTFTPQNGGAVSVDMTPYVNNYVDVWFVTNSTQTLTYVNGTLAGTSVGDNTFSITVIDFGNNGAGGTAGFNGAIDFITIWNDTKTQANITEIRNYILNITGSPSAGQGNVIINSPTNGSSFYVGNHAYVDVNVSSNGFGGNVSTTVFVYNNTNDLLYTYFGQSNPFLQNITNLPVGIYKINATSWNYSNYDFSNNVFVNQTGVFNGVRQGGQNGTTFEKVNDAISTTDAISRGYNNANYSTQTILLTFSILNRAGTATGSDGRQQILFSNFNWRFQTANLSTASNVIYFYISNTTSVSSLMSFNNVNLSLNKTYTVVITFNNTNISGYLNGTFTNSIINSVSFNAPASEITLGGTSGDFNGSIYKVAIWNRSLSASEVSLEYVLGANAPTNNTNGLVLQYLLNNTASVYSNSSHVFNVNLTSQRIGGVENSSTTNTFFIYNATSGSILSPLGGFNTSSRYLNISWSNASFNPSGVPQSISYQNLSLLNDDLTLNRSIYNTAIINNNFSNYDLYSQNLSVGSYWLRLQQTDANGNTVTTQNRINITTNTLINVTAKTLSGSSISNFSINAITDNLNVTVSTTRSFAEIDSIRGIINLSIDADGFALSNASTASVSVSTSNYSYQFRLYQTNTVNFTFYNQTGNTIMTTNVSFDLIGTLSSYTNMTTNGNILIPLLTPDTYSMRYTASGFTTRFYLLTVNNRSYQNLNLYLIANGLSNNISIYVVDEVLNPVEGAVVKALKYDLATNTYILQEIGTTDSSGKVIFTLSKYDEYYKFIVEYPSGDVKLTTTPSYITTDSLTLQISFDTPFGEEFFNYNTLSGTVTFNTLTNNFNYNYNDASGIGTNYCLYVYEGVNSTQRLINTSCSTSASGTILLGVDNTAGKSYYGLATYFEDGVEKYFGSASYQFAKNLVINNYGLFLQILITLAVASTALASPSLALILTPISLLFGRLMEFHQLSYGIIVVLTFLGMMIAYLISQRKN